MSTSTPILLVHLPFPHCRATCVGTVPLSAANIATFWSLGVIPVALIGICSKPSAKSSSTNASTVSTRRTVSGHLLSSSGQSETRSSYTACETQLYWPAGSSSRARMCLAPRSRRLQAYSAPAPVRQEPVEKGRVLKLHPDELVRLAPRLKPYLHRPNPTWPELVDAADWLRHDLASWPVGSGSSP